MTTEDAASTPSTKWVVIGGGMLGLTVAHRLCAEGHDVTLVEAADHVGGLAAPWQLGDVTWDRHYHVTLLSDLRVRGLLAELGLEDDIEWVETKGGYYAPNGQLYRLANAIDYLRLPALGPIDKVRIAATIVGGSRITNWQHLEQVPVETWLRRWSGDSAYEKLWLPLLRAKLSDATDKASAAFIWATIQRLYAARRSGLKKELFGYVRGGGYARILERFDEVARERGIEILTGTRVESVEEVGGRFAVRASNRQGPVDLRADRVVCTTAAPIAAKVCTALSDTERATLAGVRYQGVVCASVLLQKPLSPYYLTYITAPDTPFTAVVEMTAFVDPAEIGGHTLVYLPKYVSPDDPLLETDDDTIRETFLPYLQKMHPSLVPADILAFRVSKVREVFPLPTVGYSATVAPTATSVDGLYIVNSSQIVNGTLNVEETLAVADDGLAAIATAERLRTGRVTA